MFRVVIFQERLYFFGGILIGLGFVSPFMSGFLRALPLVTFLVEGCFGRGIFEIARLWSLSKKNIVS